MRNTAIKFAVSAVFAAALLCGAVWYGDDEAHPSNRLLAVSRQVEPSARIFDPSIPVHTPARPERRLDLGKTSPPGPLSKALDFEMSAASGEPKVRFKAYELAHDCAIAHLLSEPSRTATWLAARIADPFSASACGDLRPGQWDHPELRHALLREASLAGVHGAWFRLWQEGPEGPLRTLVDGPEYRNWEDLARKAALASGDPFIYAREAQEWREKDPFRALVATVVYREALARRLSGGAFDPSVDAEVLQLASILEKAIAAEAIATGRAVAANAIKP